MLSNYPGATVVVEQGDSIIVKRKLKVKSDEKDAVLKIEDFLVLVDEVYKAVKIKPGVKLPSVEKDATPNETRSRVMEDMDFDDDQLESGAMFMVWGAYFAYGDYAGFEGEQGGFYLEGEESDSFFDS